jgi:predicted transcriptional regulator YheO
VKGVPIDKFMNERRDPKTRKNSMLSGVSKETELLFENLKRIAEVLVKTFGRHCEVAIHDFSKLPYSLMYIAGTVTKRKPGAPITDLVLKDLKRERDSIEDLPNYRTTTKGGKTLKSSTAYVRDADGKPIGAFCVNFDITDYLNSVALIQDFMRTETIHEEEKPETFAYSLKETIESLVAQGIKKIGKQPATMSKDEKLDLVEVLEYYGVFTLKGAIANLATTMGISKYTLYNYVREVRSNKNSNIM